MCGICCYIGNNAGLELVFFGLKMLQNRGYDSAGICSLGDNMINVTKYASTNERSCFDILEENIDIHINSKSLLSHSRWRTTGGKTDENAHPHLDYTNKFALVHNGIIENYSKLKKELESHGIPFRSQTDTEVIVNLLSYYYHQGNNMIDSINLTVNRLEGTWGLVIMSLYEPNKLYCLRHGSPLLIGLENNYAIISSEQSGFCKYINNYICINDRDIITIEMVNDKIIFNNSDHYIKKKVSVDAGEISPAPFSHWTIKEINEQSDAVLRAMCMGARIMDDKTVKLGGLSHFENELTDIDNIILLGCGTSYHAGLYALDKFKKISGFNSVQLFDGADFTINDIPKKGKTGFIIISQSGETRDLMNAIQIAKDNDIITIGVINVVDSLIAREVTCGVYLNAGKEMGVASTKAFTSQIVVLTLIAVWFAQMRKIHDRMRKQIIKDMRRLPLDIQTILENVPKICNDIAINLNTYFNEKQKNSMFILGKGSCVAAAKEGALKIKEISYTHSEGMDTSSVKHGSFSLIDTDMPSIILVPNDEYFNKNNSVINEIKARGGYTIAVSDNEIINAHSSIVIPHNETFQGLLCVIPMQIFAYDLTLLRGFNPDFPRNLAKTCTTD